ncbi:cytochrome c-type biogenesis protein CcsB [Bacteroidales bacterium KHT7]|nr:cytochrome c-type biogenesis protein CcsB [Bacteroidales bacterium KHT7]
MIKKAIVFLYSVIVVVLAVATFVENSYGTRFVTENVYHTAWFCALWAALAVLSVVLFVVRGLWRRVPVALLHASFIVILIGALTTFLTSNKGMLHIRKEMPVDSYIIPDRGSMMRLPFKMELDSFVVECYQGTEAPSDYISYVSVGDENVRISMNNIFAKDGYRFYQSSYDEDMQGSWLSVNYDPWGTGITYAGYLLLGLSMILVLLSKNCGFRKLLKNPALKRGFLSLMLMLVVANASAFAPRTVKRVQADEMARRQVVYNDRVVPFNTLALDFVQKITGKSSFKGLSAEQIVVSTMLYPEDWSKVKMIYVKDAALRKELGAEDKYLCMQDLFVGREYKLNALYGKITDKHSKSFKQLQELDEKVALILMLNNGTLVKPLPKDGSVAPLSDSKIDAELFYNRVPFTKILFMLNLTMGFLAFFYLLYCGLKKKQKMRFATVAFSVILFASTAFHLLGYVLRWYIGGRIPLSNGFETMQFVALCVLLISCALYRRFFFVLPFGFLLSGFTLLVSYLGQMNPQITPLMPVLVSPWLSSHVSMIMMSYALFAFMMFNAILALCMMRGGNEEQVEQLTVLSKVMMYPACFFLGIGIFLGAVWANVSWGRYWAWDPKEVWALITFMVYSVGFHSDSIKILRNPKFFHWYMLLAFLTILMTYFGVNYVLGGMHSYANA